MKTDRDALQAWADNHEGWQLTRELAAKCPPCLGWYLVVDENGKLTGEIADAQDRGWSQADEDLGCVRRESAR